MPGMRPSPLPSTRSLLTTALVAGSLTVAPRAQLAPEMAEVAAAYGAKVAASALFVSGRTLESVLEQEFAPTNPLEVLLRRQLQFDVDREARTVTCRIGEASATAVYTGPLGAALVTDDVDADDLREHRPAAVEMPPADAPWPLGETLDEQRRMATGIDRKAVAAAIDRAFAEKDGEPPLHTRAVVVLHDGQLVAERYADGVTRDMPLPGWSMTKTLTNALCGLRNADGEFDPEGTPWVPAWQARDRRGRPDRRAGITNQHLLTMTAGLQWSESYQDPTSACLQMLFASTDHAAAYAERAAAEPPGSRFQYASGATNLLCRLLRQGFDEDEQYWALPSHLFAALGMRTAVLETDPNGTFVGSSYGFASARDWARLGLLYAQDGVFADERVLPEGWVARSTTATDASDGRYGWQVWLNRDPDGDGDAERRWPDLPEDLFAMNGHEGQYCLVSPTAKLVMVRLGCSKSGGFDERAFARDLHAALPE